jgi:hypothetical protein
VIGACLRHRDGSVRARGNVVDGQPDGCWEWFHLDGTRLRSGRFDKDDASGAVHQVTTTS